MIEDEVQREHRCEENNQRRSGLLGNPMQELRAPQRQHRREEEQEREAKQ